MKGLVSVVLEVSLMVLLLVGTSVNSLPLDEVTATEAKLINTKSMDVNGTNDAPSKVALIDDDAALTTSETDVEEMGSREDTKGVVAMTSSDRAVTTNDPTDDNSESRNVVTPVEQFPQYYRNFNSPYSAFYPPLMGPISPPFPGQYPASPGYASSLSYPPSPYVVQTDYDGYIVATPNVPPAAPSTAVAPLSYMRALISGFMATTAFRVMAAIVSVIGVIFFGGAITTALCSFTPICDMSLKAVNYLRRHDAAERVAKTLVEEVASERVRRTSELVWKAIRKYNEMQEKSEKN